MKKQFQNSSKILYFIAITILVLGFGLLLLEKSQVTNFYTKPAVTITQTERPVNDVQYTPADPTDNDETNQKKADGTLGQSNNQTFTTSDPIGIALTAANQDEKGGPVVVRTLLSDVSNGTCKTTISLDNVTKEYMGSVVNTGTYFACDPLDIPIADLSAGTWQLSVTVTSGGRSGTTQQNVEVTL